MKSREAWQELEKIREGRDVVGHVEEVLARVEKWEGEVKAYISLEIPELLRQRGEELERRLRKGEKVGKLAGLLVSVKDNICTTALPTTAGSRMLDGYVSPYNATVVERLLAEDAIVIGKTNLDEFAMGSTTELSAFWPTRNPWDLTRVPGGSSGGSASSLAYGGADLSLGSDTGGSARLPAAYTATVGLKPTYGLVSRYGLIPYGNSLEQISPMARSVRDVALLLEVIGGWDARDATSLRVGSPVFSLEPAEARGQKICLVKEMVEGAEEPVEKLFWNVVEKLSSEGAELEEVRIPVLSKALPTYYTIAFAEAASNLARYAGIFYPSKGSSGIWEEYVGEARAKGFGREVKRRILMGVYALSEGFRDEFYVAATRVRRAIRDEVLKLTRRCIIAAQASPILPPRIGERLDDPLKLYYMDMYTVVANLAGVPALVQPIGFSHGLPVGIQWIAGPLEEQKLISLGLLVESLTGLAGVMVD
ncbi:MAG: Asp-tRNA(Asn)/Glu-tRNA(Gln) amidotransferase subunit GatA [Acidilobaceae archaeon]|nr:Asp-tRNA(Asn)/Glu-tRNA(Gln) amidotransferase subunit GatA [Acidilobaceae archaeon]MCX8165758.1 Asp-tRNA(Asn)/Glu-tRNA(Gln) amidotransferase subunit GatA [Acidilobaceae archaeon]MDW7974183.1 Asp-tRNA(Asn)/Glu-tRNA(Gln) amidotransferase subunit GatA [Sulfolobales archaeon]